MHALITLLSDALSSPFYNIELCFQSTFVFYIFFSLNYELTTWQLFVLFHISLFLSKIITFPMIRAEKQVITLFLYLSDPYYRKIWKEKKKNIICKWQRQCLNAYYIFKIQTVINTGKQLRNWWQRLFMNVKRWRAIVENAFKRWRDFAIANVINVENYQAECCMKRWLSRKTICWCLSLIFLGWKRYDTALDQRMSRVKLNWQWHFALTQRLQFFFSL